jgi:hypothetical protein
MHIGNECSCPEVRNGGFLPFRDAWGKFRDRSLGVDAVEKPVALGVAA